MLLLMPHMNRSSVVNCTIADNNVLYLFEGYYQISLLSLLICEFNEKSCLNTLWVGHSANYESP